MFNHEIHNVLTHLKYDQYIALHSTASYSALVNHVLVKKSMFLVFETWSVPDIIQ